MILAQIQSDPVILVSWFKPLLVAALLIGWAWLVSHLDKDAAYFYLPRNWINLAQIVVGILGFALILFIPIFALGLLLGLAVLCGGIIGYAAYRNTKVPEEERWTFSTEMFSRRLGDYQQAQARRGATVTLMTARDERLDVPTNESPFYDAHRSLEKMLDFALSRGAEQLQVTVDKTQSIIAVRIDGVKYPQPALEPRLALQVIEYLKTAAKLDVQDRRKKQAGTMRVDAGNLGKHTLDLETAGSTRGLQLTATIDPTKQLKRPLDQLGLLEHQRQQLEKVLDEHGHVVLVTAPPGQGATTTLYSLMLRHDPYTSSIVTMEHEPAFEAEGVSHHRIDDSATAQTINEQLTALLRSDPTVMLFALPLQPSNARTIADSAEEVRFYASLNEDDTFSALQTWVKLVGDRRRAADAIGGVLSQRLVRKLCTTCRTPYRPDPSALKKLNLPPDRVSQLYRASGQVMVKGKPQPCPACQGLAYRGRMAVFEMMPIDDGAREFIASGDTDRLRAHLRKQRMLWLQETALAKVVEGSVDIKEITRALGGDKSGESAGTAKAASA